MYDTLATPCHNTRAKGSTFETGQPWLRASESSIVDYANVRGANTNENIKTSKANIIPASARVL